MTDKPKPPETPGMSEASAKFVEEAAEAAIASSADPMIAGLYRQWLTLREAIQSDRCNTDDVLNPMGKDLVAIEYRIAETPAQTLRGVLIKLRLHVDEYAEPPKTGQTPDGLPALDHIQVPSALADLERISGEGPVTRPAAPGTGMSARQYSPLDVETVAINIETVVATLQSSPLRPPYALPALTCSA